MGTPLTGLAESTHATDAVVSFGVYRGESCPEFAFRARPRQ